MVLFSLLPAFFHLIFAAESRTDGKVSDGEKEIQRTLLELLNQLDGFDRHTEVKIIMATNRIDCLDPALIRPGRIDRKIEVPLPTGLVSISFPFSMIHSKISFSYFFLIIMMSGQEMDFRFALPRSEPGPLRQLPCPGSG